MTREAALMAQGARCGHLEAKNHGMKWTVGERLTAASIAAKAQGLGHKETDFWQAGYTTGARLAQEGKTLPDYIINAPLPEECT